MNNNLLEKSETSALQTEFGEFEIAVYRNKTTNIEHPVLIKKSSANKPIVRIHSECATGDIFCSLQCDCKEELRFALTEIQKNGNGVLIYMRGHEGRGIGLFNKINTYKLQEQGLDTIEANIKLGFKADERNYDDAIEILHDLKIDDFVLITGNPAKAAFLKPFGFNYTAKPAKINKNPYNEKYLNDKKTKMNHVINSD